MRIRSLVALTLLTGSLAACTSEPTADPSPSESEQTTPAADVTIAQFRFQPSPLEASAGDLLTWVNADQILHTVTGGTPEEPDTSLLDGELPEVDATYAVTIDEPGTYPYFCSRHESMTGSVVVS